MHKWGFFSEKIRDWKLRSYGNQESTNHARSRALRLTIFRSKFIADSNIFGNTLLFPSSNSMGKNRMADSWIISLKSIGVCRQCDYCLESHDLGKAVRGLWWAVFCSRVPDLVLMGGTEVGPLILMTTLSDSSLT